MTAAVAASEGWRDLYDRIGMFLSDHHLEPTPEHYALAHRYLAGEDSAFNDLVDRTIRQHGGLTTATASAIIAQRNVELSAGDLSRIADEAQLLLDRISGIVGRSGSDARTYRAALRVEVAELETAAASPGRAVSSLIELTRAMIEKTRDAEKHLRRTGNEITALRDELAAASRHANSDPLTGLPNRRAMNVRLRSMIEGARRSQRPLSLAICDVDNFKLFNDAHGHQIGDEVIKFVAAFLARDNGERRFVARYGGEEFVLLIEGLDPDAAVAEIDRIRSEIAARELKVTATGQTLGKLTISAGVATLEKRDSAATFLKRADAALYRAKNSGRNRVCAAGDPD